MSEIAKETEIEIETEGEAQNSPTTDPARLTARRGFSFLG